MRFQSTHDACLCRLAQMVQHRRLMLRSKMTMTLVRVGAADGMIHGEDEYRLHAAYVLKNGIV